MTAISLNHPVTPETMLGLASSMHQLHQQQQQSTSSSSNSNDVSVVATNKGLTSPPSEDDLVSDMNKRLNINDNNNNTVVNNV